MIFFDVGGTLLTERLDPARAITAALVRLGVQAPAEAFAAALGALAHAYRSTIYVPASPAGERALWRTLSTTCLRRLPGGAAAEQVEALATALTDYPAWYAPMPGMADLLTELAAAGCRLGVISNWPPSLPRLLEHHGLGPFEVIACSGPLRTAKPDPEIFRWALAQAGIPADRAWYVGNEPDIDCLTAQALGIRAILWDPAGRHADRDLCRAASAGELRRLLTADRAR